MKQIRWQYNLRKKISSNITNVKINLDKIKLKLNLKNLSFL